LRKRSIKRGVRLVGEKRKLNTVQSSITCGKVEMHGAGIVRERFVGDDQGMWQGVGPKHQRDAPDGSCGELQEERKSPHANRQKTK